MLRELAAADAAELVEEARAGALLRAKAVLEDALFEELLSAAEREVTAGQTSTQHVEELSVPVRDSTGGELWWAYCVLDAEDAAKGTGLAGIEQATRVEAVVEGELGALISRVPIDEYGDERLREHLEDLAWLERTARAHESVQERVLEHAAIVPLRLCTLYRDLEGVRRMLRENRESLAVSLAQVAESTEWGMKVFFDGERALEDEAEDGGRGGSGREYLAGRQRQRQTANRLDALCAECAEEVHLALSAIARADRLNPVQQPETHGRSAEMILNGAYLVDRGQAGELPGVIAPLAERWGHHGFMLELTGPWPPYNFVSESAGIVS